MMDWQLLAQALHLLLFICYNAAVVCLALPIYVIRNCVSPAAPGDEAAEQVLFYAGTVHHIRSKPKTNSFKYSVRTALISLDKPPKWFTSQSKDHKTASQAREYAGTQGPVWLLTNPKAAGYMMNPISVYYCYSQDGQTLDKCIAEVTNTPWNERVTFVFQPGSAHRISKALHVSPLMDMQGKWLLEASDPLNTKQLKLVVRVKHPEHGDFFYADLVASRCVGPHASSRNEEAGLDNLWRYGLQSHRIAVWIYWQAVVLLRKGLPMYSPPPWTTLEAAAQGATHPVNQLSMCPFTWRPAEHWPWDTWGPAAAGKAEAH